MIAPNFAIIAPYGCKMASGRAGLSHGEISASSWQVDESTGSPQPSIQTWGGGLGLRGALPSWP